MDRISAKFDLKGLVFTSGKAYIRYNPKEMESLPKSGNSKISSHDVPAAHQNSLESSLSEQTTTIA